MSDTYTNNPTQTPVPASTDLSEEDLHLQRLMAEVAAKNTSNALDQQQAQNSQEPRPIEITVNGQKLTFRDNEALAKGIELYGQNLYQAALNQARQQVPAQAPAPPPAANQGAPKADEFPDFDPDRFAKLASEHPLKALEYADKTRYGIDMREFVQSVSQTVTQQAQQLELMRFQRMNPDFNEFDPQHAQALTSLVRQNNLPLTSQSLSLAWRYALSNGIVQRPTYAAPAPAPGNDEGPGRKAPIPMPNRTSVNPGAVNPEDLSLDQIEQVLRQAGALS